MTFREDLCAAVLDGRKTVTRRPVSENERLPWARDRKMVGKRVAIQPGRGRPALGHATVVGARVERLGLLDEAEAAREGFGTVYAFEETFGALQGRYDPHLEVWRIELADVVASAQEGRRG